MISAMLRTAVPSFEEEADRRKLYLLAARMLEERGRFDEAVEAYRGQLR